MLTQTLDTQAIAQQELDSYIQAQAQAVAPETEDAKTFWDNLAWDIECFPERYDLAAQHKAAGLDPRDAKNLETPRSFPRPTKAKVGAYTVSID